MRTTLTIEADVERMISKIRREKQIGLKELVNNALREGLLGMERPREARPPVKTRCVHLGACRVGRLDSVAEALALGEGEDHK